MRAGRLVLQPPEIRARPALADRGLQVGDPLLVALAGRVDRLGVARRDLLSFRFGGFLPFGFGGLLSLSLGRLGLTFRLLALTRGLALRPDALSLRSDALSLRRSLGLPLLRLALLGGFAFGLDPFGFGRLARRLGGLRFAFGLQSLGFVCSLGLTLLGLAPQRGLPQLGFTLLRGLAFRFLALGFRRLGLALLGFTPSAASRSAFSAFGLRGLARRLGGLGLALGARLLLALLRGAVEDVDAVLGLLRQRRGRIAVDEVAQLGGVVLVDPGPGAPSSPDGSGGLGAWVGSTAARVIFASPAAAGAGVATAACSAWISFCNWARARSA